MTKVIIIIMAILSFITIQSVMKNEYRVCPNILRIPTDGTFYKCAWGE